VTLPAPTRYHRYLGWHAPPMRRVATAAVAGVATGLILASLVAWPLALLGAWNALALTFLGAVAHIILTADSATTGHLAAREDVNRDAARLLLLAASVASLVAVGLILHVAGEEHGAQRGLLIAMAVLTVVVSWAVLNTVFTLRYAHLYYRQPSDGVDWGGPTAGPPDYRDFAYLAFTIGMTYQVSDTTLRDRRIRRSVLAHALLAYTFGVVILAAGINIVAGLLR
jgi:uncharacterized membrane protein